ncbi:MAG: methylmalonyl Co-A mutase-associated GTPase MeaB [Rhodobacteraceae bacterium]|nr:methylmalonyl Co-A mutase-associated GTPase MeaB [Paracoccaceae bacterium]
MPDAPDPADLAARVAAGDRRALSRAITLVESTRADHREAAEALLAALPVRQALRIGLTGSPGVGKSTFTEALGLLLTGQGLGVAVLAVDPSSARSGGSILGDKTRMPRLAREARAFIRPSPAQAEPGGVARRSREVAALCEGAGFDVILVETVGVGQSETAVAGMTDVFVLLVAPAGGDELQGVKRGIMELADLLLVNKADGELRPAALRTLAEHAGALRLLRPRPGDPEGWPRAMAVSALAGTGVAEAWAAVGELVAARRASGAFAARRAAQAVAWFEDELRRRLLARLDTGAVLSRATERLAQEVAAGRIAPVRAAAAALAALAPEGPAGRGLPA